MIRAYAIITILILLFTTATTTTFTMAFDAMMEKVKNADGFLAALDQSGGSTPKALKAYGIPDDVSLVKRWWSFPCLVNCRF